MERGIYLHPKAKIPRKIDFQIAYTKFGPNFAVGGLSALFHYNLVEQVPQQTWFLVHPDKRVSSKGYCIVSIDRAIQASSRYSKKTKLLLSLSELIRKKSLVNNI